MRFHSSNKLVKRAYAGGDDIPEDYDEEEYWSYEDIRNAYKAKVREELLKKLNLKKYGLDNPDYGQTIISRNQFDKSQYTSTAFTFNKWPQDGANAAHQDYILNLKTPLAPTENVPRYCRDYYDVKMIDLSLTIQPRYEDNEPRTVSLQKDLKLPKSRNCTFSYWIVGVESLNDDFISVILRYKTIGFEGTNERLMAVTAKIK